MVPIPFAGSDARLVAVQLLLHPITQQPGEHVRARARPVRWGPLRAVRLGGTWQTSIRGEFVERLVREKYVDGCRRREVQCLSLSVVTT